MREHPGKGARENGTVWQENSEGMPEVRKGRRLAYAANRSGTGLYERGGRRESLHGAHSQSVRSKFDEDGGKKGEIDPLSLRQLWIRAGILNR